MQKTEPANPLFCLICWLFPIFFSVMFAPSTQVMHRIRYGGVGQRLQAECGP